uniref:Uncharacterized protein n=1 Tax=Onchocerca volvulus TaxID=6282 RepID=A0A8R1Y1H0_ONCVO
MWEGSGCLVYTWCCPAPVLVPVVLCPCIYLSCPVSSITDVFINVLDVDLIITCRSQAKVYLSTFLQQITELSIATLLWLSSCMSKLLAS